MENNITNKKKLFSKYRGQKVFKRGYILLKHINDITEDESMLLGYLLKMEYPDRCREAVRCGVENIVRHPITLDFMRERGYAMDYLDCTVQQQYDFGWIKLVGI